MAEADISEGLTSEEAPVRHRKAGHFALTTHQPFGHTPAYAKVCLMGAVL